MSALASAQLIPFPPRSAVYSSLAMSPSSQRLLALLTRLCDHLSTSPSIPPPRPDTTWAIERDLCAQQHFAEAARAKEPAVVGPQLVEVVNGLRRAVEAKFLGGGEGL